MNITPTLLQSPKELITRARAELSQVIQDNVIYYQNSKVKAIINASHYLSTSLLNLEKAEKELEKLI